MAAIGTAQPFILGGIASLTAECGTFPIDTTKIRLQLQGQVHDTVHREARYRGMFHAFTRIAHEEGFGALYKGIAPALLRQASYGTLKMGLYQRFKRLLSPHNKEGSLPTNILAGMMAGILSSSVANPTDVLKVRMQAANAAQPTRLWIAFLTVYRQEGLRGLYRGVGPTAQRAAVLVGVLMPTYDLMKTLILKYHIMGDHIGTHFCAGFIAGLLSTIASNPIDVVKTRMMNQRVAMAGRMLVECEQRVYKNSLDCLLSTLRTEGLPALYKGFIPSYLRMGPWNIIFFVTYEGLTKSLGF